MNLILLVFVVASIIVACPVTNAVLMDTAQRIVEHGYPAEAHTVITEDKYFLTMFRIPSSPKLQNQSSERPAVLIMHGILCSSDSFILSGPDNALPYNLADAGYDVWLANARGNTYSKKNEKKSSLLPGFWDFTWHEMGVYDLPAMIDYILERNGQDALHYVGHSQGTTVLLVMLSEVPTYNDKIISAHLLAPIAFVKHMEHIFITTLAPFYGIPVVDSAIPNIGVLQNIAALSILSSQVCSSPVLKLACSPIASGHFNKSIVPDLLETHPAGISIKQSLHYAQEYNSGHFRQYDYGTVRNSFKYNQVSPPDYNLSNVRADIYLQHSPYDKISVSTDIEKLEPLLVNLKESYQLPFDDFHHKDFMWANDIKEVVNDRIIAWLDSY